MTVKLDINPDVGVVIDRIRKGASVGLNRGMALSAEIAAGELRREVRDTFQQHTGTLGRSFRATLVQSEGNVIRAGAYSDLIYARIQDKGGTIVPKRARFLTVPISEKAKRLSRAGGSARDLKNTTRQRHWAFVKKVRLAGRRYISRATINAREQIAASVSEEIAKGVREAE